MENSLVLRLSGSSAQLTVFFWTSGAGLDMDQWGFYCHADIFSVLGFFALIHGHREFLGGMDRATVLVLSLEQLITALLLIVNELCHRFRIPLSSASPVPLPTTPDWKILPGHPSPTGDRVVKNVAGVSYPVDVQSLVIQGIVAIHIGIVVMENSMDVGSLVQSVESSLDTSLVISPPSQSRPKICSVAA